MTCVRSVEMALGLRNSHAMSFRFEIVRCCASRLNCVSVSSSHDGRQESTFGREATDKIQSRTVEAAWLMKCSALSEIVKSELSALWMHVHALATFDLRSIHHLFWERPDWEEVEHDFRSATSAKQAMDRPHSCSINIYPPIASGSTSSACRRPTGILLHCSGTGPASEDQCHMYQVSSTRTLE